jgi:hypothetical protein
MAKNYFYSLLLLAFFFTLGSNAQDSKQLPKTSQSTVIDGLNLYPNPVSNGKVYISTKNDAEKEIVIFDLLGKKMLQTIVSGKELNVASLSPGVYIIKIEEQGITATRKLIIR